MGETSNDTERMLTVSVVEDDETARKAIGRAIRWLGYSTKSYDSAEEFLAAGEATDCLVSDVALPGMSGLELQETMRDNRPSVPMILITANNDESVERRARVNGADGFFRKPLDLEQMLDCIQRVLERS